MSKSYKFLGDEPVDVPALALVDVQRGDVVVDPTGGLAGQSQWEPVRAKKSAAKTESQEG